MMLDGVGRRCLWPATPGWYTEDDFLVDPARGLAVVASGLGAIGGQGKPAGKLAVWSLAGEAFAGPSGPGSAAPSGPGSAAEERLRRGFARANVAVERLSANWPSGLVKPLATMAALLLDGPTALVAHLGDCQIARLGPDGLSPLTRDHTLGNEPPAGLCHLPVPPHLARILTRALGGAGEPEIQRIPVLPGDVFALTARRNEETLPRADLERALRRVAAEGADVASVVDDLVRDTRAPRASSLDRAASGPKPPRSSRALSSSDAHPESMAVGRPRGAPSSDARRDAPAARAAPAEGRMTFAIVKVGIAPHRPPTRGSREAPRPRWLFAPGEPLAEPPPAWAAGSAGRGPDATWFAEVFNEVMGSDSDP